MSFCLVVGLGEEPSPSPTPSAPPHSATLTHSESWECLSTLPTNGSPLRHVTHARPRPPRRYRAGHPPPESVSQRRGSDLGELSVRFIFPQVSCVKRRKKLKKKKTINRLVFFKASGSLYCTGKVKESLLGYWHHCNCHHLWLSCCSMKLTPSVFLH